MSSSTLQPRKKENQLIIAFTGPSTSGKSSIINELKKNRFQSLKNDITTIPMEYFFKKDAPTININGRSRPNLDLKESIYWDDFFECISEAEEPIVFIDGFIAFADKRTYDFADVCVALEYNIETDFNIALDRRVHRHGKFKGIKIPDDFISSSSNKPIYNECKYFHQCVWAEMVKHPEYRMPQNWEKPLLVLSATNDFNDNVNKTVDFLKPHFKLH